MFRENGITIKGGLQSKLQGLRESDLMGRPSNSISRK